MAPEFQVFLSSLEISAKRAHPRSPKQGISGPIIRTCVQQFFLKNCIKIYLVCNQLYCTNMLTLPITEKIKPQGYRYNCISSVIFVYYSSSTDLCCYVLQDEDIFPRLFARNGFSHGFWGNFLIFMIKYEQAPFHNIWNVSFNWKTLLENQPFKRKRK